jgi:transcriptional regulator GlxA family with amidase domain
MVSVEDLASLKGLSRTVLFKRIKNVSGKTPATMLRSIRLEKARHFMLGTSLTVAEVGYSVGYKTQTLFRAPSAIISDKTLQMSVNPYRRDKTSVIQDIY